MVRRVKRGSLSSELLMCDGGVRSMLLLPLVARTLAQWGERSLSERTA